MPGRLEDLPLDEEIAIATDLTTLAPAAHAHPENAPTGHNHDASYSGTAHTHPYSEAGHTHDTSHNHDALYPPIAHTHPYAPTAHDHNATYYTESEVDTALAGKAPTAHNHDTAYFTENEVTTLLAGKSDTSHTHGGGGSGTPRESLVAQWDVSIIKTNIGAAFVDVYNQANADGKSVQIDTNGKTQVRLMVLWNKIGTGTHTVQVLEVGTANVLATLTVISGRNVSALTNIPAFAADSVKLYKLQAKSTTAADDPVFEGARVYLR